MSNEKDCWRIPEVSKPIPEDKLLRNGKEYKGLDYYNSLSGEEQMIEMMKCKMSVLYWIEHYAFAPVTGGFIHMGTSEQWKSSPKFPLLFTLMDQRDTVQLLSSRQIGKTTMALMYALWAMIFFPEIQVMFLTLNSELAKDAVVRMTGMMSKLPKWMQIKNGSKAANTTFIKLSNGSMFKTSFISGAVDPNKAGRGLSQPIIILDEFAFCNHAEIVYTAMQPSIATARVHAKKNGYPTCIIMVSTPNGAGDNTFYNILKNSVRIEDIYDFENKKMFNNYLAEFDKPDCNDYISVTIHWSETHRDEEWYKQQCKDLNNNKRRINQELNLAFLGSSSSIFDDDIIAQLEVKKANETFELPFGNKFKLFGEINKNRVYLLGVDSSASTGASSDFSAITLVDAVTGQEVGVWKGKFAIVKQLSYLLKTIVKTLGVNYELDSDNLIVIIERNSFGKGVVEELVYADPTPEDDFDYSSYVWMDQYKDGEYVHGFWTGNAGKMGNGRRDQMFSELMNHVNEYPELIHSHELISDLRDLVQLSSGRIEAARGAHDDVVMSYAFCLYVRRQMIKSGEIVLEGEISAFQLTKDSMKKFIDVSLMSGMNTIQATILKDTNNDVYEEDLEYINNSRTYQSDLVTDDRIKNRIKKLDNFNLDDYLIM